MLKKNPACAASPILIREFHCCNCICFWLYLVHISFRSPYVATRISSFSPLLFSPIQTRPDDSMLVFCVLRSTHFHGHTQPIGLLVGRFLSSCFILSPAVNCFITEHLRGSGFVLCSPVFTLLVLKSFILCTQLTFLPSRNILNAFYYWSRFVYCGK